MTMTRRDYLLLADVIREVRNSLTFESAYETMARVEERIAFRLYRYDPRFDKAMFREACRANPPTMRSVPESLESDPYEQWEPLSDAVVREAYERLSEEWWT